MRNTVIENPDILITHTWISVVGKAESETGSFYYLSVQKPAKEKADRLAFVASGRVQNLPNLMAEMTALDMNLVSIHDLSAEKNAENSDYIIELSGSDYDSFFKLKQKSPLALRYLGTFYVL